MDCLRKTYSVVVPVVYSVEKLHKNVSQNVQLFKAELIDSKWLDDVTTFTTLCVELVDLSGYPVVRWDIVVDSVYYVRHIGES